jgi:hypothetical protein
MQIMWLLLGGRQMTRDVLVKRVSDDNGKTFGQLLKLASNGTIGN